jgi:effector-associated domain 8 (EAD8)-containing protein
MANALSKMLRLLAELPFSATVSQRQALVASAGFSRLNSEVNWEGSAVTFCAGLLELLRRQGQDEMLAFLDSLMGLEEQVGLERKGQLLVLRDELAALTGDEWDCLSERLPRVFVTHNLTAGAEAVQELRDTLEGEGYGVFCEPGEQGDAAHWRLRLIRRLGACDGAVVVLGGGDADTSYAEALILRWRSWLEEHFKLFVVCLDAPAWEQVSEGRWKRLGIADEDIIYEPTAAGAIAEVCGRLEPLKRSPRWISRTEEMEHILTHRFEGAKGVFLTKALRNVGGRCAEDYPQLLPVSRLAREVLSAGLSVFPPLVNSLKGAVEKGELKAAFNLLAPSWVDIRSSGLILKVCQPGADRVFCVNADIPDFTARMYVRQAYFDLTGSEFNKRVIVVTGKDGDFTTEFVLREIRTGIIERFRVLKNLPDAKVTPDLINKKLVEREQTEGEGPTFVIFPPHLVEDSQLLKDVWAIYPSLVLVLMTGTGVRTPPAQGIEFLEPFLSPGEEDKAQSILYDYADLLD